MIPITGETREEVWLQAIDHLLNHADGEIEFNLIMEITKPATSTPRSRFIRARLDELLAIASVYPSHTVAETIFPMSEYKHNGLSGVMENYPNDIFPKIKKNPGNSKGTYAYRIVRGLDPKNNPCNPLEKIITRLRGQLERNGLRCAYEISVDDAETIPINRNDSFLMGFPCLSHLSFKLSRDRSELHLTALYRSQDYVQKAVGNLLGLARLQAVIAREIGIQPGTLVCHSTYAMFQKKKGIGKGSVQKLIDDARGFIDGS